MFLLLQQSLVGVRVEQGSGNANDVWPKVISSFLYLSTAQKTLLRFFDRKPIDEFLISTSRYKTCRIAKANAVGDASHPTQNDPDGPEPAKD